ncbi:kallikrein-8-like [Limanda limanda]|uniref:kallikrein-8-like n=1 Tax=Limanda limanda TaxID=27771 RepID=UPI0029C7B3F6|nr:kallikrein-8-like [Limanda limanda]
MARLTTLLFAMWLDTVIRCCSLSHSGVTVSTVVDLEKRILGGRECGPNERQYRVKLKTGGGVCGGSLISRQWILTAAHCSNPKGTYTAYIGGYPGPHKEVGITAPHVIFKDDVGKEHDLMLLKLPEAVDIKPVQRPDCQHPPKRVTLVEEWCTRT